MMTAEEQGFLDGYMCKQADTPQMRQTATPPEFDFLPGGMHDGAGPYTRKTFKIGPALYDALLNQGYDLLDSSMYDRDSGRFEGMPSVNRFLRNSSFFDKTELEPNMMEAQQRSSGARAGQWAWNINPWTGAPITAAAGYANKKLFNGKAQLPEPVDKAVSGGLTGAAATAAARPTMRFLQSAARTPATAAALPAVMATDLGFDAAGLLFENRKHGVTGTNVSQNFRDNIDFADKRTSSRTDDYYENVNKHGLQNTLNMLPVVGNPLDEMGVIGKRLAQSMDRTQYAPHQVRNMVLGPYLRQKRQEWQHIQDPVKRQQAQQLWAQQNSRRYPELASSMLQTQKRKPV